MLGIGGEDIRNLCKMKKILLILILGLSLVSCISALTINLNSPTNGNEYDSTSIYLDVSFSELVKCNYTLSGPLPEGESGSSSYIYKLIPSYTDNPTNYQDSPVIGYTNNYQYTINNLVKGRTYTMTLRCSNQEGNSATKEIEFSIKDEEVPTITCTDSDRGKNYFEKGETIRSESTSSGGGASAKIDRCDYKEESLTEYYCGEDKSIQSVIYKCPNGCEEGACIEDNTNSSSGGGSGSGGTCTKYYTCPDGSQVKECELVTEEIPSVCSGTPPICTPASTSINCVCNENPEQLCTSNSGGNSGGGSSQTANTSDKGGSSGGGSSQTSEADCNGCIINDNCIPFGYRYSNEYCSLNKTSEIQKQAEELCDNNFECLSNLCIDNECVKLGLWKKIMNWFKNLFG